MASSQVEIAAAASSSAFGSVLRDRNMRDRCSSESETRSAAAQAAFHKNLKDFLVNENNSGNHHHHHHHKNLRCLTKGRNHHDVNNVTNDVSFISPRKAKILDSWAARQARDMVSDLFTPRASSCSFTTSCAGENLGASSLVQIWEARLGNDKRVLNRSHSITNNTTPTGGVNRTTSSSSPNSDAANDHSSGEWDSMAQTAPSSINGSSSDAGEGEKVRIADIIKKLSSDGNDNHNHVDSPSNQRNYTSCSSSGSEQAEQRGLLQVSQVVSSPKIRGRQAFNELLLLMAKERQVELHSLADRNAVSKFNHRGRIQSLLKLKFLQRGTGIEDRLQQKSTQKKGTSSGSRFQQWSTIEHLREKFSVAGSAENATTSSSASGSPRSPKEIAKDNQHRGDSSTKNKNKALREIRTAVKENMALQEVPTVVQENVVHQEACSTRRANVVHCEACSTERANVAHREACTTERANVAHREACSTEWGNVAHQEACTKELENVSFQEYCTGQKGSTALVENSESQSREAHQARESSKAAEQKTVSMVLNSHIQEAIAASPSSSNRWDDNEIEEDAEDCDFREDLVDRTYDWISDIARPRSYWEEKRKEWYQEKLSTSSENDEIRKLLERGTVSGFLASDFREKMDQLMECRAQVQVSREDEDLMSECSQERMGQLMLSYFQKHSHSTEEQEQQVSGGALEQREPAPQGEGEEQEQEQEQKGASLRGIVGEDEFEDQSSRMSSNHQYVEATDYFDQYTPSMHTATQFRPWSYSDGHHRVSDEHDHSSITPSHASNQDRRASSSASHRSMEMELIFDLRGHMEQLQREMVELRKSIQCCMEMQLNVQPSHSHEPHTNNAYARTVQGDGRVPMNKRKCCVCCEMDVDSFLYRCGHMCTCLKCAHELQWSSGKCPICQSPILDVVPAYLDS